MKLIIDTDDRHLIEETAGERRVLPLHSPEAFQLLSRCWLDVGWTQKYSYSFTWLGRPIVQLPEDMIRVQEVIHHLRPDVIVETGVAHGGSLIFYASLCHALGRGRVIGIDIEIRPHNRAAIEAHPLSGYITLIEGGSTEPEVVEQVRQQIGQNETVLVLLDSCHSKEHVLAELRAYAPLVSPGSYIVATDGIMADVAGNPPARPDWTWDNPQEAVREFVRDRNDFAVEEPEFLFNEGSITERVTYWPSAFIRRRCA
jgi:cephalosporin hydroxylase